MALDRNFWDPLDKPGANTLTKKCRFVNLCIYVLQGSTKDKDTIVAEVKRASEIWCHANINIQAPHIEIGLSNPEVRAESITDCGQLTTMFTHRTGEECDDYFKSLAVYYIPGKFLANTNAAGRLCTFCDDAGARVLGIILTDAANARVLAHELGHALFLRRTGVGINCTMEDPDPGRDPSDTNHNSNALNLMHSSGDDQAIDLSRQQIDMARLSKLVQEGDLAVGFSWTKSDLRVTFKTLHVYSVSDADIGEDELESKWHFRVNKTSQDWEEDDLGVGKYDLPASLVFDVSLNDTDTLTVEVSGTDLDTVSDDPLPTFTETWTKAGNWGIGDHGEGKLPVQPLSHNAEIDYKIDYSIYGTSSEVTETFQDRDVCELSL